MNRKLFVCLSLPPFIKEYLTTIQQKLQSSSPQLHIIPPENLHITLKFIGEVDEHVISSMILSLQQIPVVGFHVFLEKILIVPKHEQKLIWCIVSSAALMQCARLVQESLSKWVDHDARPYAPHITLARSYHEISETEISISIPNDMYFTATSMQLMESNNSERGVEYSVIANIMFKT